MREQTPQRLAEADSPVWIDGWEVDVGSHRMRRGGDTVKLEPRAVAVLAYLADRPGKAVTREELEREVWRGLVVGYDALSNAIAKLRKAFGDDSSRPRVIETIPKVGYRLVGEVSRRPPGAAPTAPAGPARNLERKLAAIVYADVAGYSRLTGADEEGTHRALSHRLDVLTDSVLAYHGRVVHLAGDALLADFAIVSDALACAIAVQRDLAIANEDRPDAGKVAFRIGVNLGEVIVDRDDIYGDGVNVAARLQTLAEPGGVCVSGAVVDAVGNRLPVEFHYLGEQSVKNIEKPIRAYHARLLAQAAPPRPSARPPRSRVSRKGLVAAGGIAVALLAAAAIAIWLLPRAHDVSPAARSTPVAAAGEKPSIAVLPFANLSADPAQEFFVDGLTGDLITDLSKLSGLVVIARHSVFAYKDQPKPITEVAAELGVRFVVEGSVQRTAGQLRINAQLIDASSGANVWAERYDRGELDVFALQDEVIADIVETLAVTLTDAEQSRLARPRTASLEAYDAYLRAERLRLSRDEGGAIELYRRAITLDPGYTDAYAGIALSALELWRWDSNDVMPGATARRLTYDAASKLLSLDDGDPRAYAALAMIQSIDGQHAHAIDSARRSVSLDPNNADAHATLARVLVTAGHHEEAHAVMQTAYRLNPNPPAYYDGELGLIAFFLRDFDRAQALLGRAGRSYNYRRWLAMAYAELGRIDEARTEIDKLFEVVPFANLAYYRTLFGHFRREEDLQLLLGALSKAGIPQWPYGYQPVEAHRLDEASLTAITFDHTWSGRDASGSSFIQQFTNDGRVVFRGRASLLTGTVRIEADLLCVEFPGALLGREECGYVYRNPDGSAEEQNEYVRVALGDIYYFSVQP